LKEELVTTTTTTTMMMMMMMMMLVIRDTVQRLLHLPARVLVSTPIHSVCHQETLKNLHVTACSNVCIYSAWI